MKGPILSLELYGDVGLRQSHDLDLMVKPQDDLSQGASLPGENGLASGCSLVSFESPSMGKLSAA
jgi:hypothetical protein